MLESYQYNYEEFEGRRYPGYDDEDEDESEDEEDCD